MTKRQDVRLSAKWKRRGINFPVRISIGKWSAVRSVWCRQPFTASRVGKKFFESIERTT